MIFQSFSLLLTSFCDHHRHTQPSLNVNSQVPQHGPMFAQSGQPPPPTGAGSGLTGAGSGLTGAGPGLTGAGPGLTGAGPGLTGAGPGDTGHPVNVQPINKS